MNFAHIWKSIVASRNRKLRNSIKKSATLIKRLFVVNWNWTNYLLLYYYAYGHKKYIKRNPSRILLT